MTITATVDLAAVEPLDRQTGTELGRVAYERVIGVLESLDPADWDMPTDCEGWSVRDLAGHMAGMMWSFAKLRRFVAEQAQAARRAKAEGWNPVDAMTAIQVERMADLGTNELIASMRTNLEPAIAVRRRIPEGLAQKMRFPVEVGGVSEKWSMSYLFGTIITRDTWLHRVTDLARAVGTPPQLDAEHDGRIVADAVAEWARRHGEAVELTLTGPAGGRFRQGSGGPVIEVDALEFCRMTSGRAAPTHPLLSTDVPY